METETGVMEEVGIGTVGAEMGDVEQAEGYEVAVTWPYVDK